MSEANSQAPRKALHKGKQGTALAAPSAAGHRRSQGPSAARVGFPKAQEPERNTMAASRMLFLMGELVKQKFSDPGERRWRLLAALAVLDGKSRPSAGDEAMVDLELSR